jgi:glycosyltransferase involved in cell wall biosynthesis
MNLCFVTPEYVTEPSGHGGLANYLGRVTTALVRMGCRVDVLVPAKKQEILQHEGVTVHRIIPIYDPAMRWDRLDGLVPRWAYQPYQELKQAFCLWRYFRRLRKRFDLVQVANVMAVGLFFRLLKDRPVVHRLSNYPPAWDRAAGDRVTLTTRLRWLLQAMATRGARFVYAPSHFVARLAQQGYGLRKVDVIESPFFVETVDQDTSVLDREIGIRPFMLFFGSLTAMKGAHVLAAALPEILRRCPDMHVVLIGRSGYFAGGQSIDEMIRQGASAAPDRVHVLPSLNHAQLYPFVERARLVALPSLFDNLPNSCLEAMGLGKPVIATTGSCFEQLIRTGESGFLVAPGDAAQLADAIARAWTMSDDELARIGQAARERIGQLHPDVCMPRLLQYYRDVRDAFSASATRKRWV